MYHGITHHMERDREMLHIRLTATAQMAVASPFLLVATSLYAPQSVGTTLSIYNLTEPSGKAVSLTWSLEDSSSPSLNLHKNEDLNMLK
jgi:hypothetical protein